MKSRQLYHPRKEILRRLKAYSTDKPGFVRLLTSAIENQPNGVVMLQVFFGTLLAFLTSHSRG